MASIRALHFHCLCFPHRVSSNVVKFRTEFTLSHSGLSLNRLSTNRNFQLRAVTDSSSSDGDHRVETENVSVAENSKDTVAKLQQSISSLPPVAFVMKRHAGNSFFIGLCLATAFLVIAVRVYVVRKSNYSRPGSVADLVRRGQLRSDRRGISRPLKYEDPFNNPLVKIRKSNSTVEMCGKVYRLAPVTLTEEEQAIHQKRRSRAYQWKRPTMFLKEGDLIPPDVDPDTIRWIPANHPFATTASDIDEDLAQNNVYQKHGVPFRIQAEHEALQRKLEALQSEQKLNKLVIDSNNAKDFERAFKLNQKSQEPEGQNPFKNQSSTLRPPQSDQAPNGFGSNSSSEEMQKP
ncbi:putative Multiple chloroplast division site 1 [Melia azedarach]|uniref:Multiple chloroplast division site 1 n=1 Tax=Melia azedarach TaxID=155640 RepID=A0ACC1WTL3_MELAZ|nr:putative Multiple chloroplast division site 1 [Melia azedarach]